MMAMKASWPFSSLCPDLVLCDINLPVMSGFEVLERLNALAPRLGRIPFVFLTALTDRDSELRARRLGADDYVTKPIDFDMLGMSRPRRGWQWWCRSAS